MEDMPNFVFCGDWGREERRENYDVNQGRLKAEGTFTGF